MNITQALAGTRAGEVIAALDGIYRDIETQQAAWKPHSPAHCPEGCGCCCVDFEPDVLECEALYLAAWLLQNDRAKAESILDGTYVLPRTDTEQHHGCILFDEANPYHCTVYGGRALICRLFGYASDTGKNGEVRWKPCKFNCAPLYAPILSQVDEPTGAPTAPPALAPTPNTETCAQNNAQNAAPHNTEPRTARTELARRQYSEHELQSLCGALPPVMSTFLMQALSLNPDNTQTKPLRTALKDAVYKIQLLVRFAPQ